MAASNRADECRRKGSAWTLAILLIFTVSGCLGVRTRDAVIRNSARDHVDRAQSGLTFSKATKGVLARQHLHVFDPEEAALRLEAALQARPGMEPDGALALAELWYRVGLRRQHNQPERALDAYRNAVSAAAIAVGEPRGSCTDFAVDLHNDAVARLLRLSMKENQRIGAPWNEVLAGAGISVAGAEPSVDPGRFTTVDVASDIRVRGLREQYHGNGMGVPIVAVRPNDRTQPLVAEDSFLPPRQRVGATVVAAPQGGIADGSWRAAPVSLVFHDPHQERIIRVGSRTLRMSFDTSTPLAVQGSQRLLASSALTGLLTSSFQQGIEPGLYSLRPYQRGRIPVVFVHGLSSNPVAFIQELNELGNDPAIVSRYQFLVFAYPTGRPIPSSAMILRRALYSAEAKFGDDPAFHQMVLIGHSMGGNLTRMMISESGMTLWDSVLNVPYGQLRGSPETRAFLNEALIFHPVPFVRRAVFIAAPHRGSPLAGAPLGRTVSRFMRAPEAQGRMIDELAAANGHDVFNKEVFRNRSIGSIGNLSLKSPVLLAVDRMPIPPAVHCHTIAFEFLGHFPNDLVVPDWSSAFPASETTRILRGTHFSEQNAEVTEEIRGILRSGE